MADIVERLIAPSESVRRIPKVRFYTDISDVIDQDVNLGERTLGVYDELHKKFTLMLMSLMEQRESMDRRLQNLKDAKEVVLNPTSESEEILFQLSDCLYTQARITNPSQVYLWLGSNTMMAYTREEAAAVLLKNIKTTMHGLDDIVRPPVMLLSPFSIQFSDQ